MSKKRIAKKLAKKAAEEVAEHLILNAAAAFFPAYIPVKSGYKPAKYLIKGLKKLF